MKNYFQSRGYWKRKKLFDETLSILKNEGFANDLDQIHSFDNNTMLYYAPTQHSTYIIIAHCSYNRKSIHDQHFELWECRYNSSAEIGRKPAVSMECIKQSFILPRDSALIKK